MKEFGEWFERARKQAGFARQIDLANETALSISVISGIESTGSLKSRSRGTKKALARALGVSVEELEARADGKRFNPQPKRAEETRQKELVERASELVAELQTVLIQLHGYPLRGGVWEGEQRPAAPGKK